MTNQIYFNSRDQLLRLDIAQTVYFEADGNITHIITANKMRGTVGMNLGKMEEYLAAQFECTRSPFIRIGKKYIINMDFIYLIHVAHQRLLLSDCHSFAFQLEVSKEALRKVKELLVESKR